MHRAMIMIAAGTAFLLAAGCAAAQGNAGDRAEAGITAVRFTYDMYSGDAFYLSAYVSDCTDAGSKAEIIKRVGPANSYGSKKEGTISLNKAETDTLLDILSRYDLAGWSQLPKSGSGSAPSRSLMVFSGDTVLCDIAWNAKFPETVPPQEDIMYAELYNFFNGVIRNTPGWEAVNSEDLTDPREAAVYTERTVTWFGKEVTLVPGTGHDDGRYADIDYEGKNWWQEEGFLGTWVLDPEASYEEVPMPETGSLTVREDGSAELIINDETWTGTLSPVRRYKDDAFMTVEHDGERRDCRITLQREESYDRILVSCYPGPVPEPQFDPIYIALKNSTEE